MVGFNGQFFQETIIYTSIISPLARDFCDEKWDLTMATGIVMVTGWLGTDESKSGDSQTMGKCEREIPHGIMIYP